MLTDKHISIKRITKEDYEKPDLKKSLNEMLSKPTSGKTQAAMDRLLDNVLTGEKSSQKV